MDKKCQLELKWGKAGYLKVHQPKEEGILC